MAKREKKPRKKSTEGQQKLIDTDHPEDKALIAAAVEYRKKRDARMRLGVKEVELRDALVLLMQERGKEKYEHDGMIIEVVKGKTKVKVKDATDDQNEEPDGDE